MHIDKTYSLQDIADMLKRPRTTLNNWYQTFKIYLPVVGSGRTKRFKEEAIDIFRLIMELKDRNEPNEIIEQYLTNSVKEITIEEEDSSNNNVVTSIVKGYENILTEVSNQRDFMIQMYQESQAKNEELTNLIQTMSKEHAAALEKIQTTIETDRQKKGEDIEKLQEIMQKDKTEREQERKKIEDRDKQLLEGLRKLREDKEDRESMPWYKKMFK
ncbi:hypothetical protein [Niallia sp. FSL R7-0271]|uniref:hypothetical protein n=1 Tax=Niallia sp. FSL R7-0271 TaxID=2921678 RepID=UPI0030FA9DEC